MKTVQLFRSLCIVLFLTAAFAGCKKENEELTTEPLSDYLPTQPGKYIVYKLDSLVFTNFGTNSILRSYQEKHEVDAESRHAERDQQGHCSAGRRRPAMSRRGRLAHARGGRAGFANE